MGDIGLLRDQSQVVSGEDFLGDFLDPSCEGALQQVKRSMTSNVPKNLKALRNIAK